MALNINALKTQVKRAIARLPCVVDVYRHIENGYGEPDGEEFVVRLTGLYYKAQNSHVSAVLDERGETKSRQAEYFMATIDESSEKVQEGDFFTYNGVVYKIIDLGNTYGIYFDMALERVV